MCIGLRFVFVAHSRYKTFSKTIKNCKLVFFVLANLRAIVMASELLFVRPVWPNQASANRSSTSEQRRADFKLIPCALRARESLLCSKHVSSTSTRHTARKQYNARLCATSPSVCWELRLTVQCTLLRDVSVSLLTSNDATRVYTEIWAL